MSNDSDETETRRGRPTKFNESLKSKILELAEAAKTDEQIAEIIGISPTTLRNWKGAHPDFLMALKESKQTADELVEASLFHRAVGYSLPQTKVFCTKFGEIIKEDVVENLAPDTTAAIFWLKNRQPDKWRDKTEVEHSGSVQKLTDDELDKIIDEKMKKLADGEK